MLSDRLSRHIRIDLWKDQEGSEFYLSDNERTVLSFLAILISFTD